jgi:DNA-binding transcriptional regulator YiaG
MNSVADMKLTRPSSGDYQWQNFVLSQTRQGEPWWIHLRPYARGSSSQSEFIAYGFKRLKDAKSWLFEQIQEMESQGLDRREIRKLKPDFFPINTPYVFRATRENLGLSSSELAGVLNVDARTIRRWEASDVETMRKVSPTAERMMEWLRAGFRPVDWPPHAVV